MSGEKISLDLPVRKLPYELLHQLAVLLDHPDNTKNWKALIAAMPDDKYTQEQVEQFESVGTQTEGSSSEALLQDMGFRFKTVKQLISYLEAIDQYAALELLKPEVIETLRKTEPVSGRTRGMQASHSLPTLVPKELTKDPVKDARPSSASYETSSSYKSSTCTSNGSITIDSSGKSFPLPNGFFLEFPPGAVSHNKKISYEVCEAFHDQPSPEDNDTETLVSDILVLQPSHLILHKPMNISLVHSGPETSDQGFESVVKLFNQDKNQWEEDCVVQSSKIQLSKLTAIAVVSRLVTDKFEVSVSGCVVRSSVCRDVTLHFPENAVNKPTKGSIKVIPMPINVHEMTDGYPCPVIIVDGFDGYSFENPVTIKIPHPCPARYPMKPVRLMCFKDNKWRDISKDEDVKCTESQSTIELRVKHFSRLWPWLNDVLESLNDLLESLNDLFEYIRHSPRTVYFAALLRDTDLHLTRNPKIICLCVANGKQNNIKSSESRVDRYIELAGNTSLKPMRPKEKAYLKIMGCKANIKPAGFYLEFLKEEPCIRELDPLNASEECVNPNEHVKLSFYKKDMETLVSQLCLEKHLMFPDNAAGPSGAGNIEICNSLTPGIKDLHDNTAALDELSRTLDPQFKNIKNWEHFAHKLGVPQDVIRTCKLHFSPTIRVFEYLDATNPKMNIDKLRDVFTRNQHKARHDIKGMLEGFDSEDKVSEVITNSTSVLLDQIALKLDSASKPTYDWKDFGLELGIARDKLQQFEMYTNYNPTEELFRCLYATSANNVQLSVIVKFLEHMKREDVLEEVRKVTQSTDKDAKEVFKLGSKLLDVTSRKLNKDVPGVEGWRGLARRLLDEKYINDPEIIAKLEPPRQLDIHSPTKKIIEWLAATKPETKLHNIFRACKGIGRNDAKEVLVKYFPRASVIDNLKEKAKEPVSGQTSGRQDNPSPDELANRVHEVRISATEK